MRKLKIFALTTFAIMVVAALTVSVAGACGKDKTADASTAAVKGTEATVAGTGCTASKGATATTAGVGCTASKGAHATTAGMGCTASKMAGCVHGASADLRVEAVRMPSGALAVFYTGTTPATIASLQARAEKGAAEFGCDLAGSMAKNESCHVEVANVHNGVMMLVTADKPAVLDEYEAQYEIAMAQHASEAEGE